MSTDKTSKVVLDHVFMWTEPGGGSTKTALDALGLTETYRRQHDGQGTANICYCFENAFIELLWIENEAEAQSAPIARCGFVERSKNGNPFGIAWRGDLDTVKTWDFKPPYLPEHLAIKVAADSDEITQPFMFTFPGSRPPSALPAERRGNLQEPAGFVDVELNAVILRAETNRAETLDHMMIEGMISTFEEGPHDAVWLKLKRAPEDAREDVDLVLPI